MKANLFLFAMVSLLGALLIGCGTAAIKSKPAGTCGEGFVYRLPIGKIHIVAIRQDVISTNSQKMITVTNASSVVLSQSQYQAPNLPQTFVSSQSQTTTFNGTNGVTQTTTNSNVSTNYTSSSIPQFAKSSLRSRMEVLIKTPQPRTKTNYLYSIAIDIEYYPDPAPSAKILATINRNAWYDQNWGISGNNQLLSFVGTTNTDETGNIIAQALQSAASIAELVGGIPTPNLYAYNYNTNFPPHAKNYVPPAQIEVLFDPFNPDEVNVAARKLWMGGITFNQMDFSKWWNHSQFPDEKIDGVFYRAVNSYQLELSDMNNNQVTKTILLPDESSLYHVKIDKWPLVTSSVQATMNNGTLVGYSVQKPSQIEGGVALIPNTISTLVSPATQLLTALFSVKVNSAATQSAVSGYAVTNAINQQTLQQLQSSKSTAP